MPANTAPKAAGWKSPLTRASERGEAVIDASVRDFGPGIPAEHVPRLTERFYRVDVGNSRAKRGTGLGLSIVRNILLRHRGRLVVDSEVGRGSTFTVRFPEPDRNRRRFRQRSWKNQYNQMFILSYNGYLSVIDRSWEAYSNGAEPSASTSG